jgi:DNA-binding Lrp family transcriptional regulator
MDPLLKLLKENAMEPLENVAKMLALPLEEVRARIRDYEAKGIIRGYQAIVNEDALELERVVAIIEVKLVPERGGGFDRLAMRISRFPEVTAAFLVSGQADLMLFVEGRNLQQVAAFVSEKLSTIQGVTATSTAFRLKTYKNHGLVMESQDEYERLKVSP